MVLINITVALCIIGGIFLIAGLAIKNKIVRNIDEAVLRVKSIAAPLNCQRLNKKTPCAAIGKCIAFTDGGALNPTAGCHSKDRICRDYIITGEQVNPDRIKVIIVNEDIGY